MSEILMKSLVVHILSVQSVHRLCFSMLHLCRRVRCKSQRLDFGAAQSPAPREFSTAIS